MLGMRCVLARKMPCGEDTPTSLTSLRCYSTCDQDQGQRHGKKGKCNAQTSASEKHFAARTSAAGVGHHVRVGQRPTRFPSSWIGPPSRGWSIQSIILAPLASSSIGFWPNLRKGRSHKMHVLRVARLSMGFWTGPVWFARREDIARYWLEELPPPL